jgi:cell division septation protein DedD
MISPDPRDDKSEKRRVAASATVGVVVLVAIVVGVVSVPDFTSPQEEFRKLDPQRFADLQTQPEPEPEQQESDSESESKEKENPEEAQEEAEPQKAPERVEAPDLSSGGLDVNPSPTQTPSQTSEEPSESSGGNTSVDVKRKDVGKVGGAETFDDPSSTALPSGKSDQATSGSEGTGIAVAEGSGSGQGSSSGDDFGGGGEVAAGGKGQAGGEGGTSVEVSLKDVDEKDYGNLEVSKLIRWMKEHPAELPVPIQRQVGYEEENLSSKLPIEVGGETYELFLMCRESLKEVHIVLVRDQRAQYLVDRSFQKQSRKFRAGPVLRDDGKIAQIQSEGKPRGEEAEQFYDVFLSWWEDAKKDVR